MIGMPYPAREFRLDLLNGAAARYERAHDTHDFHGRQDDENEEHPIGKQCENDTFTAWLFAAHERHSFTEGFELAVFLFVTAKCRSPAEFLRGMAAMARCERAMSYSRRRVG